MGALDSIREPPRLGMEGVELGVQIDDEPVVVCFIDRGDEVAARGGSTRAMRLAIRAAREYRRAHSAEFERLFDELERARSA